MRAKLICPGGEGMTILSRARVHQDFCVHYRRGGHCAVQKGFRAAANFTLWTSARRSLRLFSSVGEAPQELTTTIVKIRVPYRVNYGEVVRVVGSGTLLGDWSVEQALQLTWTEGDVWTAEVPFCAGHYEFKCVVYNPANKSVSRWEDGGNRVLDITEDAGKWDLSCQWGVTKSMAQAFMPAPTLPLPPPTSEPETEPAVALDSESLDATAAAKEELIPMLSVLPEATTNIAEADTWMPLSGGAPVVPTPEVHTDSSSQNGEQAAADMPSASSSTALLLLATVAAAGAALAVAFLAPGGLDKTALGERAGEAVSSTLQQSTEAGSQVRAQVQSQLAALAGHASAMQGHMVNVQSSMTNGLASLQPMVHSSVSYAISQATTVAADTVANTAELGTRITRQG
ncbi:hypothetical protein Vretimale_428 [Volvox reticuliferus]|uniref:Uncharacterized protein n=1 Tax=Volvox reticuliferus TaxID=1737510 RepID=A0A8J4FF06_9CHLO|nr:hypothetical protein Vretifemale_2647 [Volvox reticuliferus]GIL94092.1 hypothetical protein Vretimale_428 [Volvox reticuliferus]